MKGNHFVKISFLSLFLIGATLSGCRNVRTARDVTPGNPSERLDWRYGSADIRIQTTKIMGQLMNRWVKKTGCLWNGHPARLVVSQVDNCTDRYISTEMVREIFESAAADDGRFIVVVGNACDEAELDHRLDKINLSGKYNPDTLSLPGMATAPEFLVKVRITKAVRADRFYDYEDYRMTVTLYDIETQEIVDSAWDVLCKQVRR